VDECVLTLGSIGSREVDHINPLDDSQWRKCCLNGRRSGLETGVLDIDTVERRHVGFNFAWFGGKDNLDWNPKKPINFKR